MEHLPPTPSLPEQFNSVISIGPLFPNKGLFQISLESTGSPNLKQEGLSLLFKTFFSLLNVVTTVATITTKMV